MNNSGLVNIIGGGTANSEFEYLTGHSLTFMSSSIPFAQHIQEKHDSIASNLSMQGYDTTAIHPLHGVNWRRNVVYPYLGFDDFIAMEDMDKKNAEYVRQFISDGYTYELVMDILKENSDAPDFVFDVTVQNHSGYTYAKEDFEEEVWVEGYDSMEVSQYLTLIKKSDEALGTFIRQLETFSEPTILVFFGDHYPRVPEDFFTWINPENTAPSLETLQKKYSVPFLIWANYDIEEETDVITSLNYLGAKTLEVAGCEMSEYDRYRLKIAEEIPAINALGYIDDRGLHHFFEKEDSKYEKIQQYWMLIYNELFDSKHKVKGFFEILPAALK